MAPAADENIFVFMRRLEAGQEEIRQTLREIQDALFGDPKYGHKGMVVQLQDHEERLRRLERRRLGVGQVVLALVAVIVAAAVVDMRPYLHMDDLQAAAMAAVVTVLGVAVMVFGVARGES